MVSRVDVCAHRGIKRAIAAIAAAVDLRVCVHAEKHREHCLKNFLFHSLPFIESFEVYAPLGGVPQAKSTP
jgi:hypothetical protein